VKREACAPSAMGKNRLFAAAGGLARRFVLGPSLPLARGIAKEYGFAPAAALDPKRRSARVASQKNTALHRPQRLIPSVAPHARQEGATVAAVAVPADEGERW
jgi:hypothetical protein